MALHDFHTPPSPILAGILGRCPKCGHGRMFAGFLSLVPTCQSCGLSFAFADAGDGPAVFVTLIGGFMVMGAVLWTEVTYSPPVWVYLVVFLPLTLLVCVGLLRPLKGILIALQYRTKAEQGRLKE